ncbi:MAG: T9SS type A sorting domain-containing protein [Bacteroidales bacterium]|jgi:hypothetical protein|nr:T9SS type A sorting domain-containing protein [Bacteroidales bacterium]
MKKLYFLSLINFLALVFAQSVNAQITVSGSTGANGSYTSLTNASGAFQAINGTAQTGNTIVITITGNSTSEAGTNSLNAGAWTSLTIYPTGTGYTISGNITGPLIDLNGADNVTIDGRVNATGNTKDLIITNTNTGSSASTIRFIESAENNTVKYCTVKGAGTNFYSGGVIFFSTASSGNGNDGNLIDNCNLTNDEDNRPYNVIRSEGSSDFENSNNTISNNNIYDFFNAGRASNGIFIYSNSTAWTITGNSFYETTSFVPTADGNQYEAIAISNTSGNNFIITGNYIGGSAAECSGSALIINSSLTDHSFICIDIYVGTTGTSIQNNTIKNISVTSRNLYPWFGIYVSSGKVNIGTVTGNTIGATTGTGSITITNTTVDAYSDGIFISDGTVDIENNNIGSITTVGSVLYSHSFYGIENGGAGPITISNNLIGSTSTENSIQAPSASTSTTTQDVYGIINWGTGTITISGNTIANLYNGYACTSAILGQVAGIATTNGANTIQNNTIRNLFTTSPNTDATTAASVIGILQTSTSEGQTVSGNSIYNLSNTYNSSNAVSVIGLYYEGPTSGANAVSNNFIHSLSLSSTSISSVIAGIRADAGTTTYSNNIINLGGSISTGYSIYGIYENGATSNNNNLYFNTVYIGGNPSGTTSSTYALYNAANTNTRDFRNNILYNARSGGTTGEHYAVSIAGTTGLTIDYNDYYAPNTGGVLGYLGGDVTTLADWKTATGQDGSSANTNPTFYNAGGITATDYIPSSVLLTGVAGTGITTDYAGTTRSANTMGAWEGSISWTGTTSTDWSVASNWSSNAVPLSTDYVYISSVPSNQPHITTTPGSPATCSDLTIDAGAILTIDAGKALTVNGTLTNDAGNTGFVVKSSESATGSLIHNTANVKATVERYIGAWSVNHGWHFLSCPMVAEAIQPHFVPNPPGSNQDFFKWDEPSNVWVNTKTEAGDWNSSFESGFASGRGYLVAYSSDITKIFKDSINVADVSISGLTYTSGKAYSGWHLLGNPFASAIKWSQGTWNKTNIGANPQIWDETTASYKVLADDGIIPAMSGFMVYTTGSGSLTIPTGARLHSDSLWYKSGKENRILLVAGDPQGNTAQESIIRFNSKASENFDLDYDSYFIAGFAPNFYSVAGDKNFALNTLPVLTEGLSIPLGFVKNASSGFTIKLQETIDGITIYLTDLKTNTTQNLSQNPVYTFSAEEGDLPNRFKLTFGTLGINEPSVCPFSIYTGNGIINVNNNGKQSVKGNITVYSITGQAIATCALTGDRLQKIDFNGKPGCYIVKITTEQGVYSQKVIIH